MIVKPKIRGHICTTAHPKGCAKNVQEQIEYVKKQGPILNGPKKVLVIGASTGYGLASRITAAFGSQAATMGVFYEKEPVNQRTATAGWYNSAAFEAAAKKEGLYARSFNGDAYSNEVKQRVISAIKEDLGSIDLLVYSLAAPRRTHPETGKVTHSVLKPLKERYVNKAIDLDTKEIVSATLEVASQQEIDETIDVMGGEDWDLWVNALAKEDLLADGITAIAFSYLGPEIARGAYREGTIGAAKDHLEATAKEINRKLELKNGRAFVSVNKALVTQASTAISFMPLYFILLKKVMQEKGLHEDCIHQICRLFLDRLYTDGPVPVDEEGRIRLDDFEMRADVQEKVQNMWNKATTETIQQLADVSVYQKDFLKLFGFGLSDVDYNEDVEI